MLRKIKLWREVFYRRADSCVEPAWEHWLRSRGAVEISDMKTPFFRECVADPGSVACWQEHYL